MLVRESKDFGTWFIGRPTHQHVPDFIKLSALISMSLHGVPPVVPYFPLENTIADVASVMHPCTFPTMLLLAVGGDYRNDFPTSVQRR